MTGYKSKLNRLDAQLTEWGLDEELSLQRDYLDSSGGWCICFSEESEDTEGLWEMDCDRTFIKVSNLKRVAGDKLRHVVTLWPPQHGGDERTTEVKQFTKTQFERGHLIDWVVGRLEELDEIEDDV